MSIGSPFVVVTRYCCWYTAPRSKPSPRTISAVEAFFIVLRPKLKLDIVKTFLADLIYLFLVLATLRLFLGFDQVLRSCIFLDIRVDWSRNLEHVCQS